MFPIIVKAYSLLNFWWKPLGPSPSSSDGNQRTSGFPLSLSGLGLSVFWISSRWPGSCLLRTVGPWIYYQPFWVIEREEHSGWNIEPFRDAMSSQRSDIYWVVSTYGVATPYICEPSWPAVENSDLSQLPQMLLLASKKRDIEGSQTYCPITKKRLTKWVFEIKWVQGCLALSKM